MSASINIAARIRAVVKSTNRQAPAWAQIRCVQCQGCGGEIFPDQDLKGVEYVKTKRGTDLFFHAECAEKVWKRKMG